jgi:hypothetical protein
MDSDRIRAKKPVRKVEKWEKATLEKINSESNTVIVQNTENVKVELQITQELLKLFTSRMEGSIEGGTVWYKKK